MQQFPCPCCGHLVFGEPPGSYSICHICFWENDALQLEYATTLDGGANRTTLEVAQRNFAAYGACDEFARDHVRPPTDVEARDPDWRLIDLRIDRFETWDDPSGRRPHRHDESLYYWLPTFWLRNPDARPRADGRPDPPL
jgi:hypothetical protein